MAKIAKTFVNPCKQLCATPLGGNNPLSLKQTFKDDVGESFLHERRLSSMTFYIFECSIDGTNIIVYDKNPSNIPAAATAKTCPGGIWTLIDQFDKGDGTYPPARETQIEQEIEDIGYYWVVLGPTKS